MEKKFKPGENVYVPRWKLREPPCSDKSHILATISSVGTNHMSITHGENKTKDRIRKNFCYLHLGILLLTIGDFRSEKIILDKLKESVVYNLKLLFSDDFIEDIKVRSLQEVEVYWNENHYKYSHVVIIGHGNKREIDFAIGGPIGVKEFMSAFKVAGQFKKTFINLSCESGYATFGKVASKCTFCECFICPLGEVDYAIASQFLQTFFTFRFFDGKKNLAAFRKARNLLIKNTVFRFWRNGNNISLTKKKNNVCKDSKLL